MAIPASAKRVFKGEIFEVYQWEQELYDGSKAVFERIKRDDTIQVIAVHGGRIVILEEEQPDRPLGLNIIGGRVDSGESPFDAARRELKEETGLESDDWELWRKYKPVSKIEWDIYIYIARNCRKTSGQKLDPGERIRILEVRLDEFFRMLESPRYFGKEVSNEILALRNRPELLGDFKKRLGLK